VDIVQETIRIAAGEPLRFRQRDVKLNGHAIECRINAEDPDRDFRPQPGRIERFLPPGGPGVRMDTHVRAGYAVPAMYDSMIGKLIVHAPTRGEAIAKMQAALDELTIEPVRTTIPLHRRIMASRPFREADLDIHHVERLLQEDRAGAGQPVPG